MYEGDKTEIDPYDKPTNEESLLFNIVFEKLPDNYKNILTLKYLEEKSQKEIAVLLNKSEKSVESLLTRSRNMLKKELRKYKKYAND